VSAPLVRRSPAHRAVVIANAELTPRMRRVTIRSDAMTGLAPRPAQDIELLLREPTGRRVKRRYTIRSARPPTGELDLDVVLHGGISGGPGAQWAAGASAGDEVEFQGPRGKLELRSAPWHLLVGDESALPAIAAICEALPEGERAIAVVEIGGAEDELPLEAQVEYVHRGEQDAGGAGLLTHAVDRLVLPGGPGRGYLMGETRAMVALRAVLEAHGIEHDAIFVKGYWNLGRPDRLAGRRPE